MKAARSRPHSTAQLLERALARLDALALGVAVGTVCGAGLCAATVILLLKGGSQVGANLSLLRQYFPGYRVTWRGALLGLGYGFLAGFVAGWAVAVVRNAGIAIYLLGVKLRATLASWRGFFDSM